MSRTLEYPSLWDSRIITAPSDSPELVLRYAVLPYAFDDLYHRDSSIVIVVSPLTALMKDQVSTSINNIEYPGLQHQPVVALSAKGMSAVQVLSEISGLV